MKNFYIFRHGETFATKLKRGYGLRLYNAEILEDGKPPIIRLAKYLKNVPSDLNVCSPFLRCLQTTQIVTEITGKSFTKDRRISEYGFELPYFFKKRVLSFLIEAEQSNHQNILICTHAIVIVMIIQYLTQGKLSLREKLIAPPPGVLTIIKDKQLKEINFN